MDTLYLIYNADTGMKGHLRYAFNKLKHNQTCGLCDITHVGLLEKKSWKRCRNTFPITVKVLYRDELAGKLKQAAANEFPCGLLDRDGTITKAIDSQTINNCNGKVNCLEQLLQQSLERV